MYSVQIEIPYWNELHAGSVGALSSFTDNTPIASVDNSLLNLIDWFTAGNQSRNSNTVSGFQDRITNPRDWERIIREGQRRAEEQEPDAVPDSRRRFPDTGAGTPPINGSTADSPLGRILDIMRGDTITPKDIENNPKLPDLSISKQIEDFLTGDTAQRIGLLLLAVLIIAIAIISLR